MTSGKRALLFGLALLVVAVSGGRAGETAPAPRPSAAEVAASIDAAEEVRRQAAELGTEWLATRGLIAQAREAAELGELQQAMELAERARAQGELAVAQAAREAQAWRQRVVH